MKINVQMLKELKSKAIQSSKKFCRLKEKQVKGCFYQATKDGVLSCVIRYNFEGSDKVYTVVEIGNGLGQVALGTALSMAKQKAKEIKAGDDPQSRYKAEKQEKKEAENAKKDRTSSSDIYVKEKAKEYYDYNTSLPSTKKLIRSGLDEIVLAFGDKRIKDVTKQDVINLLTKLEIRGANGKYAVASNVQKQGCAMWNWGLDIGDFDESINYFAVLKSIKKRQRTKIKGRSMTLDDTKEMAEIHYQTFPEGVKRAILLQAYTAVRSGCATSTSPDDVGGKHYPLDWSEFNLETGVWHIPAHRMKGREREHIIDMPQQLLAHLKLWHRQDGFPEAGLVVRSTFKPYGMMNATNLGAAYRHRKVKYTPHSWRSNISTEIAEMKGAGKEIADLILGHYTGDNYIHTTRRDERKEWLQIWADKLDTLGFDKILLEAKKTAIDLKVVSG